MMRYLSLIKKSRTSRCTEHLPAGTSGAWSLRSRHLPRQRSGAGDRGRSLNKSSDTMIVNEIIILDWKLRATPMGNPNRQEHLGGTTQSMPMEQWLRSLCSNFPRGSHSPRRHPRSLTDTDMNAVLGNSNKINSPLAQRLWQNKNKANGRIQLTPTRRHARCLVASLPAPVAPTLRGS